MHTHIDNSKLDTILASKALAHITSLGESLEAGQALCRQALQGKPVVVLDFGLGVPTKNQHKYATALKEKGYNELVDVFLNTAHNGTIPDHSGGFYDHFFGDGVEIITVVPKDMDDFDIRAAGLVVFSGSPCMITKTPTAAEDPCTESTEIYTLAQTQFERVVAAKIPTLGVCFGHQLISNELGGTMAVLPCKRKKWEPIAALPEGKELLTRIGLPGDITLLDGYVPVYHSEHAVPAAAFTKNIQHSLCDMKISHTAIHISLNAAPFTGDITVDTDRLKDVFRAKEFFALTFQSHPEMALFHPFAETTYGGGIVAFEKAEAFDIVAGNMLHVLGGLLTLHAAS